MTESDIQRQIRIAISPFGTYFRANVGQAWTGDNYIQTESGLFIKNPRPFNTGLPKGFPDLFGFTLKDNIPIFTAIEVKTPKGRVRQDQAYILDFLKEKGAIVGVARSVKDAIAILKR